MKPIIGYLHTGVEKECETRTYFQVFTLIDRLDYLSGPSEEQAFAMTVEKMMDVEVPERAQVIRVIMLELSRIASHLLWAGTSALELNMSSVFMYCYGRKGKNPRPFRRDIWSPYVSLSVAYRGTFAGCKSMKLMLAFGNF